MAWYTINHCCGHTSEVQLYGPGKNREWRISQLEKELCPECQAAEYARKSAEAAEKAKEMELPQLTGSPKQVAWAESLRMDFIASFEQGSVKDAYKLCVHDTFETRQTAEYVGEVLKETRAKWWIDNRDVLWSTSTMCNIFALADEKRAAGAVPQAAAEEMMLRPTTEQHDDIITLRCTDDCVYAKCEARNEKFVQIVKQLGYRWNEIRRKWEFKIDATTGSSVERMTELGSKLLAAGFLLSVSDEVVRQKIVTGDYEPCHPRWITGVADNTLLVQWVGRDDKLYTAAKALPGAHWERYGFAVSPKYYKRLGDFIRAYDFRVTPKAQAQMDAWQEAERQALLVKPTVKNAAPKANGAADLMKDTGVLPELIEEDD